MKPTAAEMDSGMPRLIEGPPYHVQIWEMPVPGEEYSIGADVAQGVEGEHGLPRGLGLAVLGERGAALAARNGDDIRPLGQQAGHVAGFGVGAERGLAAFDGGGHAGQGVAAGHAGVTCRSIPGL